MTITTKYQKILRSGRLTIALGLAAGALVVPAGAAAEVSSVTSLVPPSGEPQSADYSSVTSLAPPSGQPSESSQPTDYSSLSSITGSEGIRPAPVTVSSPSAGDGFDWSDAGIGALVAAALSVCAAAGVQVARRHRTLSPSA